jgi:RHS repeat-associated protein
MQRLRRLFFCVGRRTPEATVGTETRCSVSSGHFSASVIPAVAVSDAAGQAVGRVQYDPYGEVITSTLPMTLTDRLFTGARFDGTIGLYQMGARWYDPALGRWIQADTIVPEPGNPQALNRYSYVYNNPLRYTDPSGYGPPDWWDRIVKAIREWWESDEVQIRWAEITSAFKRGNEVRSPSLWDPSVYREMHRARTLMSDPEGMRKAQQAALIIELGFGLAPNLVALKKQNPDARVVGIEHPDNVYIKYSTSCEEAIEADAEVMFVDYTRDLPKDLMGADEIIAVAPLPLGLFEMASKLETAEVISDLVKPGGHIYVAAVEEATARDMAAIFSKRFGVEVNPVPVPRSEVPYASRNLGDEAWAIDFFTPD